MKTEKYYTCPSCGDLVTETQILEDCSNGSCGMCYCQFDNGRILVKYKRISKKKWQELKTKGEIK